MITIPPEASLHSLVALYRILLDTDFLLKESTIGVDLSIEDFDAYVLELVCCRETTLEISNAYDTYYKSLDKPHPELPSLKEFLTIEGINSLEYLMTIGAEYEN